METMLVITCSFNPVYESLRIETEFEGTLSLEPDVNFDDRILCLFLLLLLQSLLFHRKRSAYGVLYGLIL